MNANLLKLADEANIKQNPPLCISTSIDYPDILIRPSDGEKFIHINFGFYGHLKLCTEWPDHHHFLHHHDRLIALGFYKEVT